VLFLALGTVSVASLGVQTDEALFAGGIYPPFSHENVIRIFHHDFPLMVMTYVGTVKSWIYRPIFALFAVSGYSVRIPVLVLGAFTVWLFYRLLARTVGRTAGLAGCALLATDPIFLLTTRWDWGPVAIQHFCLVAALTALARFYQDRRARWLAAGFFLLGVGVWDKALFVWALAGIAAAAVVVVRRELRAALSPRNVAIACAFFVLGASPLILYNIRRQGVTFRSNGHWSAYGIARKAGMLKDLAQGAGLFGSVARDDSAIAPREPATAAERAVVALDQRFGAPRRNLTWLLWLPCVLAVPFLWRTRAGAAAAFGLVFCAVAWGVMALSGGGSSAHHAILIWPLPYMVIAPVLAAVAGRFHRPGKAALAALVLVAMASNLLVIATYYTHEIRNGGAPAWTDAFYSLSAELDAPSIQHVGLLDWGFFDNLRLFHRGQLDLLVLSAPKDDAARSYVLGLIADPHTVFVTHANEKERFFPNTTGFLAFARANGYAPSEIRIFRDRNGRDAIELFRFAPQVGAAAAAHDMTH
jgi:4-amino-4-deoxy-L-arabinose transferase-like glycosyltransferase